MDVFKGETFTYSIVRKEIVIEYLYILNGDKFREIAHIVRYKYLVDLTELLQSLTRKIYLLHDCDKHNVDVIF